MEFNSGFKGLNNWLEIESDGDVLLTPCVPNGITGYDDEDDDTFIVVRGTIIHIDLDIRLAVHHSITFLLLPT